MAFLDMVFDITQTDYFSYTITIFKKKMFVFIETICKAERE